MYKLYGLWLKWVTIPWNRKDARRLNEELPSTWNDVQQKFGWSDRKMINVVMVAKPIGVPFGSNVDLYHND